jgi:hypothetical protein
MTRQSLRICNEAFARILTDRQDASAVDFDVRHRIKDAQT